MTYKLYRIIRTLTLIRGLKYNLYSIINCSPYEFENEICSPNYIMRNFSIRPVMDNESTIQWIIWHNPLGFGFWWRIKIFVGFLKILKKNRKNHKNNKIDV